MGRIAIGAVAMAGALWATGAAALPVTYNVNWVLDENVVDYDTLSNTTGLDKVVVSGQIVVDGTGSLASGILRSWVFSITDRNSATTIADNLLPSYTYGLGNIFANGSSLTAQGNFAFQNTQHGNRLYRNSYIAGQFGSFGAYLFAEDESQTYPGYRGSRGQETVLPAGAPFSFVIATAAPVTPVPVPGPLALLVAAIAGLGLTGFARRASASA